MELRKICSLLLVAGMATAVMAVPARPGGFLRTAEDGTEKVVFQYGDEHFHYLTDADGNWLDETTLQPLREEVKAVRQQEGEARAKIRRAKQVTGLDRLLAPRGIVILVNYKDKSFAKVNTNAAMTQWAMGDNYTYNGATGSIRQYFLDQSWGQYALEIDVVGPVTVSQKASYYGQNNSNGDDMHPDELVVEACQLAHEQGADFSKYDWDNDGKVDWVVVIYAGKGEADGGATSTIWPHQYELSYTDMDFQLDGKTIDHYCCLSEQDGQTGSRNGIGTFCHEFSHVMGLPDLYATNDATHHTLCDWDIMDAGPYNNDGNTPPAYSAYERWFMGWFQPTLVNSASSVVLPDLTEYRTACYMTEQGDKIDDILDPDPTVFYLFENRQNNGWDEYIPGAGLLITKVSFSEYKWVNNTVNNSKTSMGVDIMEAKANTTSGYEAKAKSSDLYPEGATTFTKNTNYQITNIALQNEVITFDVNGGGAVINLNVENVQQPAEVIKLIEEGKVVIIRDGKRFDILGNRL